MKEAMRIQNKYYKLLILTVLILTGVFGCSKSGTNPPVLTNHISLTGPDTIQATTAALVEVRCEGISDLFALSIELHYPDSLLTCDSAWAGDLWSPGALSIAHAVTSGYGISVGEVQTDDKDEITGRGTLATFQFHSVMPGTLTITMAILELIDDEGNSLEDDFDFTANEIFVITE
jgi:hypothetical protein